MFDSLRAHPSSALQIRNINHTTNGATKSSPTPQSNRLIASAKGVMTNKQAAIPAINASALRNVPGDNGFMSGGNYLLVDPGQCLGEMFRLVHHGETAAAK